MREDIAAVNELGNRIGFGMLMELASAIWRAKLKPQGIETGAFIPTLEHFLVDDEEIREMTKNEMRHYDILIKKHLYDEEEEA